MPCYEEITRLVSILSGLRESYNHHGARVAEYAMKLAAEIGLSESDVKLIGIGARLHDVGKLLIDSDLLNLTRKLTPTERIEIQAHTTMGWAAVNEAGYDEMICQIVRHHHERWDGKGYPDGLLGSNIPLGAQITGVCDVYDALTSKRSYREAYSHEFTMAFMQKDKGTKFNPKLIDLLFAKVAVK